MFEALDPSHIADKVFPLIALYGFPFLITLDFGNLLDHLKLHQAFLAVRLGLNVGLHHLEGQPIVGLLLGSLVSEDYLKALVLGLGLAEFLILSRADLARPLVERLGHNQFAVALIDKNRGLLHNFYLFLASLRLFIFF